MSNVKNLAAMVGGSLDAGAVAGGMGGGFRLPGMVCMCI